MVNYGGGTGHIVNVIAVERSEDGCIGKLWVRNPWGFDQCVTAERFLAEWRRMRQSRRGVGKLLPVFDRGYLVIAPPDKALPPARPLHWLHSAPVNALVASMNGVGGSAKTICNGHRIAGGLQMFGNIMRLLGGLASYIVGNLIGKNMEFGLAEFLENCVDPSRGRSWHRCCSSSLLTCSLRSLQAVGWSLSMVGGLMAAASELLAQPLLLAGEASNRRDAVREHVAAAEDCHLRSVLVRASTAAKANQLRSLLRGPGRAAEADCVAAMRLVKLGPCQEPNEQLDALIDRLVGGDSSASGSAQ
uniref:Uncharacterized protein n=1 Tax=Pyrodinium bahamense TaxID=73915 RepID=A0A7S0FCF6_9DINO